MRSQETSLALNMLMSISNMAESLLNRITDNNFTSDDLMELDIVNRRLGIVHDNHISIEPVDPDWDQEKFF